MHVKYLRFSGRFPYVSSDVLTAVALPLGLQDEMQCIVVLPKKNLGGYSKEVISKQVLEIIDGAHSEEISLEVPEFEIDRLCDLTSNLRQIQPLRILMSDSNGLGGMSSENLNLCGVLQRNCIKVDEFGVNFESQLKSIDMDISETQPFMITRVGKIRDARGIPEGVLGYVNKIVSIGDIVHSIDGLVLDTHAEDAHHLLRGESQSIVKLVLIRKGNGSEHQFQVALLRESIGTLGGTCDGNAPLTGIRSMLCFNRPFVTMIRHKSSRSMLTICSGPTPQLNLHAFIRDNVRTRNTSF